MRYLWLVGLFWLTACDRPAPQSEDFDQTCSVADDCAIVFNDPNSCNCSCGEFDAINVADLEQFTEEKERFDRRQRCRSGCDLGCLYEEDAQVAVCNAGTCDVDVVRDTGESR